MIFHYFFFKKFHFAQFDLLFYSAKLKVTIKIDSSNFAKPN